MKWILTLIALPVIILNSLSAENFKKHVGVISFYSSSNQPLVKMIEDLFVTSLINSGNYNVIDRNRIKDILKVSVQLPAPFRNS